MTRKFYWICILLLSVASPALAKTAASERPTPTTSSKAGTQLVPVSSPVAKTNKQAQKKPVVIVTPDTSRGAVSPALLAKQQAASPAPAPVRAESHPEPHVAAVQHTSASTAEHMAASSTPVIRNNTLVTAGSVPVRMSSGAPLMVNAGFDRGESGGRLARVTAYWAGEGDYYTGRCMSATGVRLHDGHCAVDPNIIPYGSVVAISGVGRFLAVDTGSAVINRTAAREGGHTDAERHAIVVDVFFEDRDAGERFAAGAAKYVSISWYTPTAMNDEAKDARSSFADENWVKIQSKQL